MDWLQYFKSKYTQENRAYNISTFCVKGNKNALSKGEDFDAGTDSAHLKLYLLSQALK